MAVGFVWICDECRKQSAVSGAFSSIRPEGWELEGQAALCPECAAPKLLPCPFCGGEAALANALKVRCRGCLAEVSLPAGSREELLARWNCRSR